MDKPAHEWTNEEIAHHFDMMPDLSLADLARVTRKSITELKRILMDDQAIEIATEQGMLHGADAYNDAMGYSLEGPGDWSWCLRPMVRGHHGCSCDDDE